MYEKFPGYKNLKQCHTLSQGLLCVLKATFSNECHTRVKAICVKLLTYFENII